MLPSRFCGDILSDDSINQQERLPDSCDKDLAESDQKSRHTSLQQTKAAGGSMAEQIDVAKSLAASKTTTCKARIISVETLTPLPSNASAAAAEATSDAPISEPTTKLRVVVVGCLPSEWIVAAAKQGGRRQSRLSGAPWNPPIFVPDSHSDDGTPAGIFGFLKTKNGLFPAPLPPRWIAVAASAKKAGGGGGRGGGGDGGDGGGQGVTSFAGNSAPLITHQFRLLGRLFGKALMDEFVFPLPLHPAFFSVLRGDAISPSVYFGDGHFEASTSSAAAAGHRTAFPRPAAAGRRSEGRRVGG